MKRRSLAKIIGTGLLAGAMTFLPAKKAVALDDIVSGKVITTTEEKAVDRGVRVSASEYLGLDDKGNEIIGDMVGEAITDSNGEFNLSLEDNSSSHLKLEIADPDSNYYQAVRYVDLRDGNINLDIVPRHDVDVANFVGGGIEEIEKMDFMQFFNEWCRPFYNTTGTERWEEQPKVYIYTGTEYTNGIEIAEEHISMAENIIQNIWPQFTKVVGNGSFINTLVIEKGENPPDYSSNSYIRIEWDNSIGSGIHGEWLDGNKIYSGIVAFNPDLADSTTYMEELIQVLGPRSEAETRYFYNIDGEMLESGYEIGKFLYSRPIENMTPDINPVPKVEIIRYLRPIQNLEVENVSNGTNKLQLSWGKSPSEDKDLVEWYRILKADDKNLENNCTAIDSVRVGFYRYIDDNIDDLNKGRYYGVQAVKDEWESEKAVVEWRGLPIGVEENSPTEFSVSNAYPNPFNSGVSIDYNIPYKTNVELVVYDINGRKIKTLENYIKDGGSYSVKWNGKNDNNELVGNGVYLYQIKAGENVRSGKMSLVK